MPTRYFGRKSYFKGKTLFEIACNLKNFGEGRVVYRFNTTHYPEVSYYRLTKVVPVMTSETRTGGKAWGWKVFRGREEGMSCIEAGMKRDWRLVPKHEEEEFCKLPEKTEKPVKILDQYISLPPVMEMYARMRQKRCEIDDKQPLRLKLKLSRHSKVVFREQEQVP